MKVQNETVKKTERYVISEKGQLQEPKREFPFALAVFIACVVIGLSLIAVAGVLPRLMREQDLNKTHEAVSRQESHPVVTVVPAKKAPATQKLVLPANIEAIQEIPIYARTSGYLKERLVDIGDRVAVNQLLMVIATPEIDKQLQQARADLAQAESALKAAQADFKQSKAAVDNLRAGTKKINADLTYSSAQVARYAMLARQGAVSLEQRDLAQHNVDADKASLEAAEASIRTGESQVAAANERVAVARSAVDSKKAAVEQYQQLAGFQRVLAPSSGVITARNVDAGALVTAGSTGQNTELLKMARTDVLRVFVNVPQSYYQSIHAGDTANITLSEMPSQVVKATVKRVAGGLDAQSRTLLTEVHIPNQAGKLLPGMYAQVELMTGRSEVPVIVPSNAIVVRNDGTYVATVDSTNHLHYNKVLLGRDFGHDVEITTGLVGNESVALDVSDELKENHLVVPKAKEKDED